MVKGPNLNNLAAMTMRFASKLVLGYYPGANLLFGQLLKLFRVNKLNP